MTHKLTHFLNGPEDTLQDLGATLTGDTAVAVGDSTTPFVVAANGGAANVASVAVAAAALVSLVFLADVPCVVTLTGATVIDGITTSTVTLTAGVIRQVTVITGSITSMSVGANTTGAGPAGTIKIRLLYNA